MRVKPGPSEKRGQGAGRCADVSRLEAGEVDVVVQQDDAVSQDVRQMSPVLAPEQSAATIENPGTGIRYQRRFFSVPARKSILG